MVRQLSEAVQGSEGHPGRHSGSGQHSLRRNGCGFASRECGERSLRGSEFQAKLGGEHPGHHVFGGKGDPPRSETVCVCEFRECVRGERGAGSERGTVPRPHFGLQQDENGQREGPVELFGQNPHHHHPPGHHLWLLSAHAVGFVRQHAHDAGPDQGQDHGLRGKSNAPEHPSPGHDPGLRAFSRKAGVDRNLQCGI